MIQGIYEMLGTICDSVIGLFDDTDAFLVGLSCVPVFLHLNINHRVFSVQT